MKEYIAAGDVFQVVPSQRFSAPFTLPPFALYRALRRINPAPSCSSSISAAFAWPAAAGNPGAVARRYRDDTAACGHAAAGRHAGGGCAAGSGTAGRSKGARGTFDAARPWAKRCGRVAAPGTVRVTESFAIERFSHVMHISSTVEGRAQAGLTALDALVAGFPAGTLTGAPKIRAMQIIDEMEPSRRGIYAGCIGYFGADGTLDTCIGLRTAVVKDGEMHVQAGWGVVADSRGRGGV